MEIPLEIVGRNGDLPNGTRAEIEAYVDGLERLYDRIVRCRVAVEGPGNHHQQGRWTVKIELSVPRNEFVVSRQAGESLPEALRESFDAAERILSEYLERCRRQVKTSLKPKRARVARIFHDRGYGFLEDEQGREIYFHQASVLRGGFEHLQPGSTVRFQEEAGIDGPQASTVAPARLRRGAGIRGRP